MGIMDVLRKSRKYISTLLERGTSCRSFYIAFILFWTYKLLLIIIHLFKVQIPNTVQQTIRRDISCIFTVVLEHCFASKLLENCFFFRCSRSRMYEQFLVITRVQKHLTLLIHDSATLASSLFTTDHYGIRKPIFYKKMCYFVSTTTTALSETMS